MRTPAFERGVAEARGELAGVEDARAGVIPEAAAERGRVDLGLHRRRVEDRDLVPELAQRLRVLQPGELVLVGQREQLAGDLEVAVDPVAGEVLLDAVEVLEREPFEGRHLVGEAREAVLDPVREAATANPPLRPLAPNPAVSASSTTTSRPCSAA